MIVNSRETVDIVSSYLAYADRLGVRSSDRENVLGKPIHNQSCACMACCGDVMGKGAGMGFELAEGKPDFDYQDTIGGAGTSGKIAPGTFVGDVLETPGDSDWFSIELVSGESYTFSTSLPPGGLSDSILTLRDANGNVITTNDDANGQAGLFFSEIRFTAPTSGTYFLEVTGFGAATGAYYLSSSRPVADAEAANASTSAAIVVGGPSVTAQLEQAGDRDWYSVTLVAGQAYEFLTSSTGGGSDVDTTLTLRDPNGGVLAFNDDSNGTYSSIKFTATSSGIFYLDVGGWADGQQGAYKVSAQVAAPLAEFSNDQIAAQLLYGTNGSPSDLRRFNVSAGDTLTVNITSIGAAGQFFARAALELWSDVTGIIFREVSSSAQITFQNTEEGAFASIIRAGQFITSATVNISTQWLSTYGTTLDSYSFQTYLHEVGHALGLRHPVPYGGSATYPQDAAFLNDSWATTLMSYFSQDENTFFANQNFSRVFTLTPMIGDLVAIQTAYGAYSGTRTGDSTYGVDNNTGRTVYGISPDTTNNSGNLLAFVIVDNGGIDTLNYSSFSANQLINLNQETFSNVGGSIGNMNIARGTVIENAIGGSGDDQIIGNDVANSLVGNGGRDNLFGGGGDDLLSGGTGDDVIDGGLGNDTAVFNINFADAQLTLEGSDLFISTAALGRDRLIGVENLRFLDGDRTVASIVNDSPPTITTLSPTDGAINVAVGSNVVVNFSENIRRGSGTIEIRSGSPSGPLVEAFDAATSPRITVSGQNLTIDPTNDLVAGTTYFVVFAPGSVLDLAGNPFAGTSSYDFTTAQPADTTPPSVTSFTPTDGAYNVAVGSNINFQFSESIQRGTGTIEIRSGSSTGSVVETFDVATSARLTVSGNGLIIDPTTDLANGTTYFVVVPSDAIRDLAGNPFAGTNAFDFTTAQAAESAGALLTLSPGNSVGLLFGTFNIIGTRAGSEAIFLGDPISGNLRATLDPSFNQGGDTIAFAGSASDYTVVRSGSSVVVTAVDGSVSTTIPVGVAGANVVFANGPGTADDDTRVLRFDSALGGVVLSTQVIGTNVTPVAPNAIGGTTGFDFTTAQAAGSAGALLTLSPGNSVGLLFGTFNIIGTRAGSEAIFLGDPISGNLRATLDPSFNQGGDTIAFAGSASDYTVVRSGSSVVVTAVDGSVSTTIPVGVAGANVVFANGPGTADDDTRVLRFDSALGGVVLGTQVIGTNVTPVAPTAIGGQVAVENMTATAVKEIVGDTDAGEPQILFAMAEPIFDDLLMQLRTDLVFTSAIQPFGELGGVFNYSSSVATIDSFTPGG